jgi:hypothetical protein
LAELERLERRFGAAALTAALEARLAHRGPGRHAIDDEAAVLAVSMITHLNPGIAEWAAALRVARGVIGNSIKGSAKRLYEKHREAAASSAPLGDALDRQRRLLRALNDRLRRLEELQDDLSSLPELVAGVNALQNDAWQLRTEARLFADAGLLSGLTKDHSVMRFAVMIEKLCAEVIQITECVGAIVVLLHSEFRVTLAKK